MTEAPLTQSFFDAFSPIIRTKTLENAVENGDFRKTVFKVENFENASFLMWTGENGDF